MPQSIQSIYLHLVFGTKNRDRCLHEQIQPKLFSYLAEVSNNLGYKTVIFGGHVDHVHGLVCMGKEILPKDWIRDLKSNSSRFLKTDCGLAGEFHWQSGYSLFSVSPKGVESCRKYIQNQAEHHRTKSYQEEVEDFLDQYAIDVNKEYLWKEN